MTDARGSAVEQIREVPQGIATVDASGRIMRRVDDDQARPRADRRFDGGEVEIERRPLESHLAWRGVRSQQHRRITEPRGFRKNRFASGPTVGIRIRF